jgi:excisionase family DNA binding protein
LYLIADAAKTLGCTEIALRRKLERGQIPSQKFGSRRVIAKDTINRILRGESVSPSSK